MIYIYTGSGVNPDCITAMEQSVIDICGAKPEEVIRCDFSQKLVNASRILIPGGNALHMSAGHFTTQVAEKVNTLVRCGTQGFFSCAGSYVMAGNLYMQGNGLFIYNFSGLEGVSAGAICPAFTRENCKPRNVAVRVEEKVQEIFWNMGPAFNPTLSDGEVIASYVTADSLDFTTACVRIENAVHCGVHPEISRLQEGADKEFHDDLLRRIYGCPLPN